MDWQLRIKLGADVAEGLVYLHTAFEIPFIHRDIKTANILLNDKFIAKVCRNNNRRIFFLKNAIINW